MQKYLRLSLNLLYRLGPFSALLFVLLLFALIGIGNENFLPSFFSLYNEKTILTQTVIIGIGALGMTLVIISGGIDLSVGSQIALGTVVISLILNGGESETAGFFLPLGAALGGIVSCAVVGWIGGFVSARFRIVPFIVTLGTMQITRGTAKWFAGEQTVPTESNWLQSLMLVDPDPSWLIFAPGIWITLILLGILYVLLKYTVLGRHIFAIGSNEQTARLCGIRVEYKRVLIYTLCGLFTGVAAVMQYSNLTIGDPTAASGMELDIIAAVVIGGGSLSGGEGSATGSIVGALMIAVLRNGCNILGVPTYIQEIIIGLIIVGAVLVDNIRHKRRS
ncbi:MAG: ABC transporter permease [Bacteroidia bacterium]|nr:ABC transporter permease [Bacteroidia bacterium]